MFHFEASVVVNRPLTEVFEFMADAENEKQWRSAIVELRRTQGAPGQAGARYAQRIDPKGPMSRVVDADFEIVALEPGKRIQWATTTPAKVRPSGTYRFYPEGAGRTRITLSMEIVVEGLALKLLQPVMQAGMEKAFAADFQRLKAHLERA
jgi:uncharacterized membrane protein